MINVTKTYLPNIEKYKKYIEEIYDSNQLTNNGILNQKLEKNLSEYLGVKNLLLVTNGTMALQLAYRLLRLEGEVITTPFSFVATTSSLVWEGLSPNFVDINPKTLNIDFAKIDEALSENVSGILPVHVFGNSCEVAELDTIAKKYKLKIIYDAAHAFGVKNSRGSILENGDISILSFHATKVFHTVEGGALIIKDDDIYNTAKQMINFGFEQGNISSLGINTKMNEFQAAMGLCVLEDVDEIIEQNKIRAQYYTHNLKDVVEFPSRSQNSTNSHYAYFPILLKDEKELLKLQANLNSLDIFPRRYFLSLP